MSIEIEAQKFIADVPQKYPHLRGKLNQGLIEAIVAELKSLGVYREDVTAQSFHVGLIAAMESGRIPKAPVQVVERVIEKIPEPKKLTSRQIQESTGTGTIGGRKNHAHPDERVITDEQQQRLIAATEKSGEDFVLNTLQNPPGASHAERDRVRSAIGAIVMEESADETGRWSRTARRVRDEVLAKFDRGIR